MFDAPDPVVTLDVACSNPVVAEVSVQNRGRSGLVAGVEVGIFRDVGDRVATVTTTKPLFPGQTEVLPVTIDPMDASSADTFYAEIVVDPMNPTFNECRPENNTSPMVTPDCVQ